MGEDDERRRDARHASAARISWGPGDARSLRSEQLRDVSSRGMFVVCDDPPEMFTEVRFELFDDEGTVVVRGNGRVVWIQPGVGVGIELVETQLGASEIDRLKVEHAAEGPSAVKVQTQKARAEVKSLRVGIDLGTCNTCAAVVSEGKPLVIPTRYGTHTIPSVLTIGDDGAVLVGQAAAKRMLLSPERTVYGSKRLIGRTYRDEVASEYQPFFAYPIVEAEEQRFGADLGGRVISMEEVARHILGEVRQMASRHLGGRVDRAVVTVPAYFSEVQRAAVRRAAGACGLEECRIISEPTAAAVAYGSDRREDGRIVVFDLGGGTFDVSVLDVSGDEFEVVATGGDCFLGGIDFDDFIASHILDEFRRAERVDLEPDAQQLARLREAAEEAKRGLSVQRRIAVSLPQFAQVKGQWRDVHVNLDREMLESVGAPLLDRMMQITAMVLDTAEISVNTVEDVLLVGGMTRMPMVQKRVEDYFRRRPSRRINPDEAVARGAALVAHAMDEKSGVKLVDVLPLAVGIAGEGRRFLRLLSAQTRVPTERTFLVATERDGQTRYEQPLFQGERADAAANEYMGTLVIDDIPPGPAGSRTYELVLALDAECVMSVSAREARSATRVPVRLERTRPVEEVVAGLGAYTGEPLAPERPRPVSALGRLFSRIRKLLRRG